MGDLGEIRCSNNTCRQFHSPKKLLPNGKSYCNLCRRKHFQAKSPTHRTQTLATPIDLYIEAVKRLIELSMPLPSDVIYTYDPLTRRGHIKIDSESFGRAESPFNP